MPRTRCSWRRVSALSSRASSPTWWSSAARLWIPMRISMRCAYWGLTSGVVAPTTTLTRTERFPTRAGLAVASARRIRPSTRTSDRLNNREENQMTHEETIQEFSKTLDNLERWMEKAEAFAKEKGFEVDNLVKARLAPDAFAFDQQVQAACDQAKYAAAYLGSKPPPSHPDTEKSFAELHARVKKCRDFLATVNSADFSGSEDRKVSPAWLGGAWLKGKDYVNAVAVPNFYFHATMAYAILRHNGVTLGKQD